MKISVDFNQKIKTLSGEDIPLGNDDKTTCLGDIVETCLSGTSQNDKRDGRQKAKDWRFVLMLRKDGAFNTLELNDKQRSHIIEMIRMFYPAPLVSEQAALMIDPDYDDEGDDE